MDPSSALPSPTVSAPSSQPLPPIYDERSIIIPLSEFLKSNNNRCAYQYVQRPPEQDDVSCSDFVKLFNNQIVEGEHILKGSVQKQISRYFPHHAVFRSIRDALGSQYLPQIIVSNDQRAKRRRFLTDNIDYVSCPPAGFEQAIADAGKSAVLSANASSAMKSIMQPDVKPTISPCNPTSTPSSKRPRLDYDACLSETNIQVLASVASTEVFNTVVSRIDNLESAVAKLSSGIFTTDPCLESTSSSSSSSDQSHIPLQSHLLNLQSKVKLLTDVTIQDLSFRVDTLYDLYGFFDRELSTLRDEIRNCRHLIDRQSTDSQPAVLPTLPPLHPSSSTLPLIPPSSPPVSSHELMIEQDQNEEEQSRILEEYEEAKRQEVLQRQVLDDESEEKEEKMSYDEILRDRAQNNEIRHQNQMILRQRYVNMFKSSNFKAHKQYTLYLELESMLIEESQFEKQYENKNIPILVRVYINDENRRSCQEVRLDLPHVKTEVKSIKAHLKTACGIGLPEGEGHFFVS